MTYKMIKGSNNNNERKRIATQDILAKSDAPYPKETIVETVRGDRGQKNNGRYI